MNPEHKESGADFLIRTFLEKYAQLAVKEAREQDIEEMRELTNTPTGWDGYSIYCKAIEECISIVKSKLEGGE
jgi:biotin synthase-related radical SAM superfamily protein